MRKGKIVHVMGVSVRHFVLLLFAVFSVYPIIWVVSGSFKDPATFYASSFQIIPKNFTLGNYYRTFTETPVREYLKNSLITSALTTLVSMSVASLAAYGFTRFRFKGSRSIPSLFLVSQLIPGVLLLLPLFIILAWIGLVNTRIGLVLTYTSFSLPFSTWMLHGYFKTIPIELEEAALIDGCNRIWALLRVVLPVVAPGMAVVAMFTFLLGWKDFLFANVILRQTSLFTLPLGLTRYGGVEATREICYFLPMATLTLLVPLLFFTFMQRYIVGSLAAGSVKG